MVTKQRTDHVAQCTAFQPDAAGERDRDAALERTRTLLLLTHAPDLRSPCYRERQPSLTVGPQNGTGRSGHFFCTMLGMVAVDHTCMNCAFAMFDELKVVKAAQGGKDARD